MAGRKNGEDRLMCAYEKTRSMSLPMPIYQSSNTWNGEKNYTRYLVTCHAGSVKTYLRREKWNDEEMKKMKEIGARNRGARAWAMRLMIKWGAWFEESGLKVGARTHFWADEARAI